MEKRDGKKRMKITKRRPWGYGGARAWKDVLLISGVLTASWQGWRRVNRNSYLRLEVLPVKLGIASFQCRLRGCNPHFTRWQKRFLRAPLTYTLAPHAWLPGGLNMIASSWPATSTGSCPTFLTCRWSESHTKRPIAV